MISAVRRRVTIAALLGLLIGGVWWSAPYISAAAFVLDISGAAPQVRKWLPVRVQPVTSSDLSVPTRHGPMSVRVYRPARARRSVIVFPGVHAGGLDEPRLVAFSSRLAATGAIVVSAPLPELRRYAITPVSTDQIEDAIAWMASDRSLAPSGRVDIAAVSLSGGLTLVAAGRPSLDGRIGRVISLGGHADLPNAMTYWCTGRLPDGTTRPPHDYAVAITLLATLPHLVPADQLEAARAALVTYLDASSFANMDSQRATSLFAEAQRLADAAPEPSRTLLEFANHRDVAALGPKLLPFVEAIGGAPALSPMRSHPTRAPVFLLHGEADNVIPSSETPRLAEYLKDGGNPGVHWLLTPLISHAEVKTPGIRDAWQMIRFWVSAGVS